MQDRSLGLTALSLLAAMVGIYSFMAALAMLYGGAIGAFVGSDMGHIVFALGAVFLGLSVSAFVVAGGLWLRRSWSWAGGIAVFAVMVLANLVLSTMAGAFINVLIPVLGAVVGVGFLYRPSTRAILLGGNAPESGSAAAQTAVEVANTAA
ncbi:MAG: hypothetical protein ACC726_10410 [Chloroflexota bacterium]